jgi:hypothetical protein
MQAGVRYVEGKARHEEVRQAVAVVAAMPAAAMSQDSAERAAWWRVVDVSGRTAALVLTRAKMRQVERAEIGKDRGHEPSR